MAFPLKGSYFLSCCLLFSIGNSQAGAQPCPAGTHVLQRIQQFDANIESGTLIISEILKQAIALKDSMTRCGWHADSVLALVWHKTGVYYNIQENYEQAMQCFQTALHINLQAGKVGSRFMAARSSFNLAYLMDVTGLYRKALSYFDSTCILGLQSMPYIPDQASDLMALARYRRACILYDAGDFEGSKQETELGIDLLKKRNKQDFNYALLHTKCAEANLALGLLNEATVKNQIGQTILKAAESELEWANGLRIDALIASLQNHSTTADQLFNQLFKLRKKLGNYSELAQELLLAGDQLIKQGGDLNKSEAYMQQVISLAKTKAIPALEISSAWNNLGVIAFMRSKPLVAAEYYQKALYALLGQPLPASKMQNPSFAQLAEKGFLSFALSYLANKAEALMAAYPLQPKQTESLQVALKTSMLADSVITQMRQDQTEESTKLYWRKRTKWFFANSLEICYLLQNIPHAFYFMEKSRAVLLNDQLNELGAQAMLPAADKARGQNLRELAVSWQLKMNSHKNGSKDFLEAEVGLRTIKDSLRLFIADIEKRFPAYYLYKYASDVPTQANVQQVLKATGHQFVHYFTADTVYYMLATGPNSTSFQKMRVPNIEDSLRRWVSHCSDPVYLNQHYADFMADSYRLYQQLFKPLQLPHGRVVVSQDQAFLPFEALPQTPEGNPLLLQNYVFSYAYSARFLMDALEPLEPAHNNFLGMAPVSFAPALKLVTLRGSKKALQNLEGVYPGSTFYLAKKATKRAMLKSFGQYSIINLYSHARADSQAGEPAIFLQDSAVLLGELGLLKNIRTQLMVLSACQTSSGALARGEGIYSMARGFAASGIPAAVATVWRADEQSVYTITQYFHQHLARGLPKDVALQEAKIDFLKNSDKLHQLPFYWANITLNGSYAPMKLAEGAPYNKWIWASGFLLLMACTGSLVLYARRKRNARKTFHSEKA